jgi:hypothetical protein
VVASHAKDRKPDRDYHIAIIRQSAFANYAHSLQGKTVGFNNQLPTLCRYGFINNNEPIHKKLQYFQPPSIPLRYNVHLSETLTIDAGTENMIIIIFESASSLLSVVANQIPYFDISSSNLSRIIVAVHFLL